MKPWRFLNPVVAVLAVPLLLMGAPAKPIIATTKMAGGESAAQLKLRQTALEIVVNSNVDVVDGRDAFTSLREAIVFANLNPGTSIKFAIPGTGTRTISPLSSLPRITGAGTILDAFTQPGSSQTPNPNTSVRQIVLDGTGAGSTGVGLTVAGANIGIKGINITAFGSHGIKVESGASIVLTNNAVIRNSGDGLHVLPGAGVGGFGIWVENAGLGINYLKLEEASGRPTPNDALDADNIPNFPVISTVNYDPATTEVVVSGTLAGRPNSSYLVETYLSPAGDASGFGEGALYHGKTGTGTAVAVRTNAVGNANWTVRGPFLGGGAFSAVASRTSDASSPLLSSEFSRWINFSTPRPLSVSGVPASLTEGGASATVTVSRDTAEPTPLTVTIFQSPVGQIDAPATVTIPAGRTSTTMVIRATDDQLADGTVPTVLAATATDRTPGGSLIQVLDNDPAAVVILPGTGSVAEGGAALSVRVLRNTVPAGGPLTVNLNASPAGQLAFPPLTVIPAGANEVTISISALDDTVLDGNVSVVVTPSASGFFSVPGTFLVLDNEVPGLVLTLPGVASEGSSETLVGTLSRQGLSVGAPLTANLTVSPVSQFNMPVSVTIPAGQSSVNFNFTVVDDVVFEPSPRSVTVTAAASGFNSGTALVALFDNDSAGRPLQAWGYNELGQTGLGNNTNRSRPASVGLARVVTMAANGSHSLAVLDDGTVRAWGYNGGGQLGDGTFTNRNTPVVVAGLTNVRAVAAGWYHSLALKGDGTVWAWGYNKTGQLGDGTITTRRTPVRVNGLLNIKAIAAGAHFSVALRADGTAYAWGNNLYGQLGDGTNVSRLFPNRISSLPGVSQIAAGAGHTMFLRGNGSVFGSGWNAYGQLGDGTQTDRKLPVAATGVGGVTKIAGGYAHSLLLTSTGSALGFGDNSYGQLGGGAGLRVGQALVNMGGGWTDIATGSNFSLLLASNGTVHSTGSNNWGQLGRGSVGGRTSAPQQVLDLFQSALVAAGYGHGLVIGNTTPIPSSQAATTALAPSQKSF